VVIDPDATWSLEARDLESRATNSPWVGRALTGRAVHTLLRGGFTLRDGRVRTAS
jgi:dihydroorotase